MITVQQADEIIDSQVQDFGTEEIDFQNALGRVLAENIRADRDLPPFDRPTVDGIAINFQHLKKGFVHLKLKPFNRLAKHL